MKNLFVSEAVGKVGHEVELMGWVHTKRDHKKVVFIDLRDRSGIIQVVGGPELAELSPEDVVSIKGLVKNRPEKLINPKIATGKVEVEETSFKLVAKAAELPLDMGKEELDVTLPVLLDYRTLTLRHDKISAIFKVQETIADAFRSKAKELGCVEIFVPTIVASATEGGAEVFNINYYGQKAFLSQSPQLYKQMLVPVFERVYTIAHAYRAEPSVTTRHLSESTQMDCEFGFVVFNNLLDLLEDVGVSILKAVNEKHERELKLFGVEKTAFGKIPRLTLREAQDIIAKFKNTPASTEKDLSPQDETNICQWAKEKYGSDLVTVTHFPTSAKPFYTMPDPADPEYSLSYDLLYRGMEVLSGSQRIHDYNQLVNSIKSRGMNPENFDLYLQAFKYGMPPEGGFSFGLERVTKNVLGLTNIREGSLFPRDMERVDIRLSSLPAKKNVK